MASLIRGLCHPVSKSGNSHSGLEHLHNSPWSRLPDVGHEGCFHHAPPLQSPMAPPRAVTLSSDFLAHPCMHTSQTSQLKQHELWDLSALSSSPGSASSSRVNVGNYLNFLHRIASACKMGIMSAPDRAAMHTDDWEE